MLRKYDIHKFIVSLMVVLMFFSSTCLWSETNLGNYLKISILIVGLAVLTALIRGFSFHKFVNNRYVVWVVGVYTIFEFYGFMFLRIGQFNWDFVLFSGVLQICLTVAFMSLNNLEDTVSVFCVGCKWALLFVCIFMIVQGSLSFSNITFGSRLGDELSGNVNTVATNIGIMLIPTIYYAIRGNREKKIEISTWFIIALGTLCMVLTGSKKGLLVLGIAFMMYFIIVRTPIKYLILPALGITGIYAIFNVPVLYNTIGFRVLDMFATFGIGTSITAAQSTAIRNSLIQQGARSFLNHPIFGGGMNYFQYINHARYYAHNNYIELLNDFGLVGTLIYYVPFAKALIRMVKKVRYVIKDEKDRRLYIFLISFISTKFVLDWAMVSFSALCTFTVPFLFVFEALRMERERGSLSEERIINP